MISALRPVFLYVIPDLLSHEAGGFDGAVLPCKNASCHDPVEPNLTECLEKDVPIKFAFANVEVLMHASG